MPEGQTNPNSQAFDFLGMLKNAEPIVVLASLSLVIAVFTFDHKDEFPNIYNYSVTASFMFILSFVFGILSKMPQIKEDKFYDRAARYGVYFFLAIGIVQLLLITYEFSKQQNLIFMFASVYILSFVGGLFVILSFRIYKKDMQTERYRNLILPAFRITTSIAAAGGGLLGAASFAIEAFTGIKLTYLSPQTGATIVYYGFASLGLIGFGESIFKIVRIKWHH